MLSTTERVFFLARVPLFAQFDLENQARIAQLAEEVSFEPGEHLFRQSDPGDALYIVLDGEVAILLDDREINRVHPGESLGEIALLDRGLRTAGARAATDVLALKIERHAMADLLARSPELRTAVVAELGARLRTITARLRTLRNPGDAPPTL